MDDCTVRFDRPTFFAEPFAKPVERKVQPEERKNTSDPSKLASLKQRLMRGAAPSAPKMMMDKEEEN